MRYLVQFSRKRYYQQTGTVYTNFKLYKIPKHTLTQIIRTVCAIAKVVLCVLLQLNQVAPNSLKSVTHQGRAPCGRQRHVDQGHGNREGVSEAWMSLCFYSHQNISITKGV